MKNRMFSKLSKRLAAAAIVGLAVAFPAASLAAQTVKLEGAIGVANVTTGEKAYKASTNATFDQVVKVEVYYHNTELPESGKVANNLTVKINMPKTAGKTQTVSSKISADNANTVTNSATVKLADSTATLQYIPGSAMWKHNTGTNSNVKIVESKISDDVVLNGAGLRLENEKPCFNFAATVTVLARVMTPGVTITKQVEKASEDHKYAVSNTANPGDRLRYKIEYKNSGNTEQKKVVIRDSLPVKMNLVPNTSVLYNSNNPKGKKLTSNNVTNGGIIIGDYLPGGNAVVVFEVDMPKADALPCGNTTFTNVGVARPEGMNEYYNVAKTTTNKKCVVTAKTPTFVCKAFDATVNTSSKTVTVSKYQTAVTGGAAFKNVVIDWGDSTDSLTTNKAVGQKHTYAAGGSYTITATSHFTVNGKDQTAGGCEKSVSFATPTTPTTPQPPTTPEELPHTGAAQMFGLFGVTVTAAAVAHRLFATRRQTR
jgi:uncharacterized repeat protein (TIGR01451 family)